MDAGVAAIIAAGTRHSVLTSVLGFVAVMFATINVVGGFVVTHRMLKKFQRKEQ